MAGNNICSSYLNFPQRSSMEVSRKPRYDDAAGVLRAKPNQFTPLFCPFSPPSLIIFLSLPNRNEATAPTSILSPPTKTHHFFSHPKRHHHPDITLAPSPRIAALLSRRTRTLALSTSPQPPPKIRPPLAEKLPMADPPAVAITPADPWPRPYHFEGGLRRVAPYHFTYNTNCKMRWRGRELLDIFESEFRDRPVEYYVS